MISSIGYEKASLEDFIHTLRLVGVTVLVDVRDRAQSRRKGFSKTALSNELEENGIQYIHLRELGDPKEGRDAARAGNWEKFDKIYRSVLASEKAQIAVGKVQILSSNGHVCLLCYERDHRTCHRKYITDQLEEVTGLKAKHIGVQPAEIAA